MKISLKTSICSGLHVFVVCVIVFADVKVGFRGEGVLTKARDAKGRKVELTQHAIS